MKKRKRFLHWAPRILCIFMILFVSVFALDSFGPNLTFWQQIGGFIIHLIPSYILIASLVIAWKWEYVGGWIFTVLGILFSIAVFLINFNRNHFSLGQSLINMFVVAIPFVAVGLLFLWSYHVEKASRE